MTQTRDEAKIQSIEEQILREEKQIEAVEARIEADEAALIEAEADPLARGMKRMTRVRAAFVRNISRYRLIYSILGGVGVTLFWRGIWETSARLPILASSLAALVVGILILVAINRYTDLD